MVLEKEQVFDTVDFTEFKNVQVFGINIDDLNDSELEVLYTQCKYCQAMVDADIDTMKEIVPKETTFRHMSGMVQTRDEYFDDIKRGRLNYYNIGIENPIIEVNEDTATIEYTSILDATAYGAKGVYRMNGVHKFKKIANKWYSVN